MIADESKPTEEERKQTADSRRRRWPWVVLGLLVLLTLLVLLPTLLSTPPGRRLALGMIGGRVPGELRVQSWSLAWFGAQRLSGVDFTTVDQTKRVHVGRLHVPAGLPSLLGSTKKLGTVEVESLEAEMVRTDDPFPLQRLLDKWRRGFSAAVPFELEGTVKLTAGKFTFSDPEAGALVTAQDLNGELTVESLREPLSYNLTGALGEAGRFEVNGDATLVTGGEIALDGMQASAAGSLRNLDLAQFDRALGAFGIPLNMNGIGEADVDLALRPKRQLSLAGRAAVSELGLSGKLVGQRPAKLGSPRVVIQASASPDRATLDTLELTSDFLIASVDARLPLTVPLDLLQSTGGFEATLDLAETASAAPGLLQLRKGLAVEGGTATAAGRLQPGEDGTSLTLSAELADLAARLEGEEIVMERPFALDARTTLGADGPRLDRLALDAPFATVESSGTLDDMSLSLAADLGAMTREAARFLEFGERSATGRLSLQATLKAAETEAPARRLRLDLLAEDVRIAGLTAEPLALPRISATARGLTAGDASVPTALREVELEADAGWAEGRLTASRLAAAEEGLRAEDVEATLNARLADLSGFARSIGMLTDPLSLEGTANASLRGSFAEGLAEVTAAELVVADLVASSGERMLAEPRIQLAAAGSGDTRARSLALDRATLQFSAGTLRLSDVRVNDWARLPAGTQAALSASLDAGKLHETTAGFVSAPGLSDVAGQINVQATLSPAGSAQAVRANGTVESLTLTDRQGREFSEPRVAASVEATVDPDAATVQLSEVRMESRPLRITAHGTLEDWADRRRLALQGQLAPDFARVAELVRTLRGGHLEMAGTQGGTFSLAAELGHEDPADILHSATAKADLQVQRIARPGLEATDVAVHVDSGEATLRMAVEGGLNGGRLSFQPVLLIQDGAAVLTIPEETANGLSDVRLTDEMANQFLSRALPAFRRPLSVQGTVGLDLQAMRAPLRELKSGSSGQAQIRLQGVALQSSSVLGSLLELAGLENRALTVPDQVVDVGLSEGRFRQQPLSLRIDKYELIVSGAVGLDKSLDLRVELPITEALAPSEDVYEILEGKSITARVGGTLDEPQVQRDVIRENMGKLLRESAVELLRRRLR